VNVLNSRNSESRYIAASCRLLQCSDIKQCNNEQIEAGSREGQKVREDRALRLQLCARASATSARPCLVSKNFAKFFRFSVTSNF